MIAFNAASFNCGAGGIFSCGNADMMPLQEFGGDENDPPDELIYKKLAFIQKHMAMNFKCIEVAKLNPKSPTFEQDIGFYMRVFSRLQTEKWQTLRDIGHQTMGDCRCIYCMRVIPKQ
nr:hypothetical protein [uncultured Novosphingobium sp.]